jgi:hypothetical protein
MSHTDIPAPWQIIDGPRRIVQNMVDGTAWLSRLERGAIERSVIVVVSREALTLDVPDSLPVQTREAIRTDGRSEAARVAQFDDPATCVVLGRDGYLPIPPGLVRLGPGPADA